MKLKVSLLYIVIIFSGFFFSIFSQVMSEKTYSGMKWRLIGPYRAGWGTVAEGIRNKPNTYYFGGAGGGVWKTTDAGRTWDPLMQNESASAVGALAIAPSNPDIIYVGTGQVAPRYDILDGNGVFKTIDGGKTWENIGLEETKYIGKILIDPGNPDKVLVAALGHVFGNSKERGIYLSIDGGNSWQHTLFVNDSTGAVDMAYDEQKPEIIYAALWQMRFHPWLDYFDHQRGKSSGIYKSMDGGLHWFKISSPGLPAGSIGRIGIAVGENTEGKVVYATIDADSGRSGFYASNNGGNSWKLMNTDSELVSSYFSRITVDPVNPLTLYVMGRSIHQSTDGGKTFEIFKGSPGGDDYHYLWINPLQPDHMITASDQGTVVTVNNGQTWSSWYNQPTGQFYHLAADNRFPYRIYSGQQDNGTVEILSQGPYGVIELRDWHPVGSDERDYDIPKPGNPDIVFGSGLGGSLHRFNELTRQSIDVSPWPHSSYAAFPPRVKYRYSWITPIEFSPVGNYALYFGAQYLFRTTNDGNNWEIVSPDLSRKNRNTDTSNCIDPDFEQAAECGFGVIWNIAPSPIYQNVIWVGTDDGLIHLTTDYCKSWKNVTPPSVPLWARIDKISPSAFDIHSAYAAINTRRLDHFSPVILKTTDDGKSWQKIVNGIPGDEYVNAVCADNEKKGLLFAATNRSVYVSFNDGKNWHSLKLNFPTTSIRDLLIHKNDLIAATQGRGIWILDNLSPLRQISDTLESKSVYLFKPLQAWRMRGNKNHDTPWPPSTPLGQNPPEGAMIDYWLKDSINSPVKLSIYDSEGNLIRSYSSDEKPEELPAKPYFDSRWLGKNEKPSKNAGMHRFVWNLRYPRPKALQYHYSIAAVWTVGTPILPLGPYVIPGRYKVILTVNDKNYIRHIDIKLDPRVKININDLKAQLTLAQDVQNTLNKTVELFDSARLKMKSDSIMAENDSYEELKQFSTSVANVSNVLSGFASSVQAADAAPTQGQLDLFKAYKKHFSDLEEKWKELDKK
ncbi:MAG: hypothetical protein P8Z35_03910 [Ignavibacteriaceae bacterium]